MSNILIELYRFSAYKREYLCTYNAYLCFKYIYTECGNTEPTKTVYVYTILGKENLHKYLTVKFMETSWD